MRIEWKQFMLGELCSLITDGKHGDCQDDPGSGFYFLSVKDVLDNRLVYENARQITKEDFLETHRRTNLKPGDILFTNTGTIGRMAIVPSDPRTFRTTFQKSVAILKPRRDLIEPSFLYYLLHFDNARLSDFAAGTTQKNLLLKDLRTFVVEVPDLPQQRAIAHILGTLDDKIELNRRMNETLEAMARAIFKSWFVDFDPVHAKAEGRDPGLPNEIADLFPDGFEDSELGEIPAGWPLGKLGDALSVIETGGRPKGGVRDFTEGVPSVGAESIVGISHFDYGKTKFVPREFFQAMTKGHVRDGDVLLYKDGGRPGEFEPHTTMVGDGFPFSEFCINEHVYRLRAEPMLPQSFLYLWLSSDTVMEEMRNRGTGVAVPGLNSTAVRSLALLIPPRPILDAYEKCVATMIRRIFANCHQSRILAALRDTLLPKLISGELRVPVRPDVTDCNDVVVHKVLQ